MSDYIKREDAVERLQVLWDEIHDLYGWSINPDCKIGINESMRAVASVPSVDVEPVRHGKWLRRYEDCDCLVCSECGTPTIVAQNYCCVCGSRMDGGNDE